jgi:hypothetical protein
VNILEQILLDSPLRELNKEDLATSGRRLAASVVDLGRRRRRRRRRVTTFLLAESINHGITMRTSPTLQYLHYIEQIGLF